MIKQYEKKDGTKAWMFKAYLGVDDATGKKIWTTRRGFKTKRECQLAQTRLQLDVQENGFQKRKTDVFKEMYELWFEQYKNTVKESSWVKTAEMFRLHILPRFGHLKLEKINVAMCQKAINEWFATVPSRYMKMKNYTAKVFDFAIAMEITEKNPMRKVTNPVKKDEFTEEAELNFYSREELKQFLAATKELDSPTPFMLFHLLAFTGMRKGEALALMWTDINFKENTLTITKNVTRGDKGRLIVTTPKTRKSARTLSIDPHTMDLLKAWRCQQKIDYMKFGYNTLQPDQLIFPNESNELMQPTRTRKWLMQVYKNHPEIKPITTHGFRHTHCSLLFEAGASIKEVQDRLGHSDVKVTMNIYAHVTKERKEETAMKFANFMAL
ncbi:tyrosine-type recombinase/integrase [Enterococcus italicus]|uniref:tyrosine-type recombinase/integrase n=1 Tax=Enterococcus italicus TaxID=246144 RepID=UPI0020734991|nr:tyrosine-type recombinase/integrase [Enterococcus italicus]